MKKNLKFFLAKVFFAVGLCAALQAQSTELQTAILLNDENEVRKLIEQGADINAIDKDGVTAFGCAILNGTENMVRLLLDDYGADANAVVNISGQTALGSAISGGAPVSIVRLLLEKGADPSASGDVGHSAIYSAAYSEREDYLAMIEPYIHDYSIPRSYDKAYSYRTGEPYPSMANIPSSIKQLCRSNPEKAIDEICNIIRREAENDFEKAKMAHDYVAMNITYDDDAARRNNAGEFSDEADQGWKIVLRDGKGVCAGYSSLFKKIMDELNIKCEIISGFVGVGDLRIIGGEFIMPEHIWNVVFLEGAWYIVDSTWDCDKDTDGTKKNDYRTEYLFMKSEDFIRDHYPTVKKHQLLQKPLTPEQLKSLKN